MASTSPEATRLSVRRWNRRAWLYDLLTGPEERILGFARARRRIFERAATGRVLEVGAGTGKNLPYYPADAAVLATDLSAGMLARAASKARGRSGATRFLVTDAEDLAFKAGAFDSVVATFVFCSVSDRSGGSGRCVASSGRAARWSSLSTCGPEGSWVGYSTSSTRS